MADLEGQIHELWERRAELTPADGEARGLVVGTAAAGRPQAQVFDPLAGSWSLTGSPAAAPGRYQAATLLQDGRVLVVGGYNSWQSPMTDAEVYDPWTNTWTTYTRPGASTTPTPIST